MTRKIFTNIGKLSLCALLLAHPLNSTSDHYPSESLNRDRIIYYNSLIRENNSLIRENINPDECIKINSVTNLIANPQGDEITFRGIEDALRNKVSYITATSNLPDAYSKSESELLMISGHHFTGTVVFFDNRKNYFVLRKLPPNPAAKILVMRGCHTVMNPLFLEKHAEENKYLSYTAKEYIDIITGFAPNVRLMIGYETKSPFVGDHALISIVQNLSIAEKQGLKSYGEYAVSMNKKMFEYTGHEKDASGDWKYNTNYHKRIDEGSRIAYYIKENDGWRYYSMDNPQGVSANK